MAEKPVRVLIADDSEDDRILLGRHLRILPGFHVIGMTTNGVETIAWLNASPPYSNRRKYPYPDLLLLDYQMPGYSGLEVLQWLDDQPRHPKVILWTHTLHLIDLPKAHGLCAAVIAAKPGTRMDLSAILARAFPLALPSSPRPDPLRSQPYPSS